MKVPCYEVQPNTYLREPRAVIREDGHEASAAAPVAWDIEHRKSHCLGCRGSQTGRRQYVHHRYGERIDGPTVSKTPDTQVHTLSGPGRSSYCPAVVQGREGKVATPKPEMHGMKKSLGRKPIAKRMSRFLKRSQKQLIRRLHRPMHETGKWLEQALNGWLNYYAVPTSYVYLARCYGRLYWIWMRVLRRRSQRDRATWETMDKLTTRHWPKLRIRHPWPATQFSVKHVCATQTRSHMR